MNRKTQGTLFLLHLCIQCVIALLLSLVITIINYGFAGNFAQNWAKSFVVAFIIIPLALRLITPIAWGVRAVLGDRSAFVIRCVVSVCVAAMMEGLITFAITLSQFGFAPSWLALWANAFLKALPVGLFIGFTMTFLVHPRIQRLVYDRQHAG